MRARVRPEPGREAEAIARNRDLLVTIGEHLELLAPTHDIARGT